MICIPRLALLASLLLPSPAAAQEGAAPRAPWSERAIELAAELPIQDGGRVKPLDTYAQFRMLRMNGKRKLALEDGEKLTPTPWLLDCLFFPERARGYRHFLVRDSAVLDAIGVRVPGARRATGTPSTSSSRASRSCSRRPDASTRSRPRSGAGSRGSSTRCTRTRATSRT